MNVVFNIFQIFLFKTLCAYVCVCGAAFVGMRQVTFCRNASLFCISHNFINVL